MRKAGELAGVGEGWRGRALSSNKIKTYSVLKQHFVVSTNKIQQINVLKQHNVGFSNKIKTYSVFKTVFCR